MELGFYCQAVLRDLKASTTVIIDHSNDFIHLNVITPLVEGSWDNRVLFGIYTQIPGEGIGLKVFRLAARQQIQSQKLHFLNTVGDTLPRIYTNSDKWQACTAISSSLASWNILREGQLLDEYHLDCDHVWQISHNFQTVNGCIFWPSHWSSLLLIADWINIFHQTRFFNY